MHWPSLSSCQRRPILPLPSVVRAGGDGLALNAIKDARIQHPLYCSFVRDKVFPDCRAGHVFSRLWASDYLLGRRRINLLGSRNLVNQQSGYRDFWPRYLL